MPCNFPMAAWQTQDKDGKKRIHLSKARPIETHLEELLLPCQKCQGCRHDKARDWALRCHLEGQQHRHTVFVTLTYDEQRLPPTLQKRDLQLWLKRFRKELGPARPIRFFASGEYGEQFHRPHYHALVYGASQEDRRIVEKTWGMGRTSCEQVTAERIAYCAGYTQNKIADTPHTAHDRVDPDTGELYRWQPPFIQMSRRPGIGGQARKHTQSWEHYAIHNGSKMRVPRFYHEAWKAHATEEQVAANKIQRKQKAQEQVMTLKMLAANEAIAVAKQALKACTRTLG